MRFSKTKKQRERPPAKEANKNIHMLTFWVFFFASLILFYVALYYVVFEFRSFNGHLSPLPVLLIALALLLFFCYLPICCIAFILRKILGEVSFFTRLLIWLLLAVLYFGIPAMIPSFYLMR